MVKLNSGIFKVNTKFTLEQLNEAVQSFISRVYEIPKNKVSVLWDSTTSPNLKLSDDMDFSCKISLTKTSVSATYKHPFEEMIVFQESSKDMESNLIYMVIDYLDLDDHEFAHELKNYTIKPLIEDSALYFTLMFDFKN